MFILWFVAALVGCLVLVLAAMAIFTGWMARLAEREVPRAGRFIEIDGVKLHYVEQGAPTTPGTKPTLVMIHGLASQLQSYTYAVDRLLRDRFRIIIVDRPGSGYSQPAPSADFSAQAALIDKMLGKLGVDRALVVGHSLGGAIGLTLALNHPGRVAGLALLAPATQHQEEAPEALKALMVASDPMRWLIGWTVAAPMGIASRQKTLAALFGPDPAPADFGTRGGGLLVVRPWTFRNASRDLVGARDGLPENVRRYGELTMPVGILFGAGDKILDAKIHGERMLRAIPHLHLELIANAGHMVPLSHPERTAAFIESMAAKSGLLPAATHV